MVSRLGANDANASGVLQLCMRSPFSKEKIDEHFPCKLA